MPPEETAVKSPLDKPLHLLTEDDIAQVTREDCRRYLKEKGMRTVNNGSEMKKSEANRCKILRRNEETFVEQISGDSTSNNAEDAPWNDTEFGRWSAKEASYFAP